LRLFSFGGYGLALVALTLVVFGAIECPPFSYLENIEMREQKKTQRASGCRRSMN